MATFEEAVEADVGVARRPLRPDGQDRPRALTGFGFAPVDLDGLPEAGALMQLQAP